MKWYVSCRQQEAGDGSKARPFRTIGEAACAAQPGDEVIVLPGIYREQVDPPRGGTGEEKRIVYRAEQKGTAVITGAEQVVGWTRYQGTVWQARVPNELFGSYHPYRVQVTGDWYYPLGVQHAGEVYLNGHSLFEAQSLEEVLRPPKNETAWDETYCGFTWFAEVREEETVLYANFQETNPNQNLIEINVRRNCFFPSRTGIDYITVSGFVIRQAATIWAPPTAFQDGMIGPHWSKGWIIEDCEISDSKCCGISLGKVLQPGNENKWTLGRQKIGTQNERDIVCQAWKAGWNKDRIGSHIIRRNCIHDCEQAGIAGHLGCIFSVIEDNHIYRINNKQQITGAEIAGIKLHAAIDTQIRRNHIHHCTRGIWLDWQAQGTRVTQNLLHDNVTPAGRGMVYRLAVGEDLFIEVSHGPTTVDHNLFLSPFACRLSTQGIAFLHNWIAGSFTMIGCGTNNGLTGMNPRYTPYHEPHETAVDGFMTILHGDARFYNNVFVQPEESYDRFEQLERFGPAANPIAGTIPYEDYPGLEEYFSRFREGQAYRVENYYGHLPVEAAGNVFCNGAKGRPDKTDGAMCGEKISYQLSRTEEGWYFETDLYGKLPKEQWKCYTSDDLGMAFEPEERFENPDGSDIIFDRDYFGASSDKILPGPFAETEGHGKVRRMVWKLHQTESVSL